MRIEDTEDSKTPNVQQMDKAAGDSSFTSRFHCEWDWHMRKLRNVPAVLIYQLAARVTARKRKKEFKAAAETVAVHFGINTSTVRRAIKLLCRLGFFEKLGMTEHGTNRYRVISHDEWVKKHPGQCVMFRPHEEPEEPESPLGAPLPAGPGAGTVKPDPVPQQSGVPAPVLPKRSEAVSLVLDLAHLSGGKIVFLDKHRDRLGVVRQEYTSEEIKSAFTDWLVEQDLSDPKNVQFLPGTFAQIAGQLAETIRRERREAEAEQKARDVAVKRLQAEAEADRQQRETQRQEQENQFDPLADLLA